MSENPTIAEAVSRCLSGSITFSYTNYRGETAIRCVLPISIRFGATDWHPEPQWLLRGFDFAKEAEREFALSDCDFTRTDPPETTP